MSLVDRLLERAVVKRGRLSLEPMGDGDVWDEWPHTVPLPEPEAEGAAAAPVRLRDQGPLRHGFSDWSSFVS